MTQPLIFNPLPIAFERGEGVWLWDTAGEKYLDGFAGIAVCCLGHSHPALTQALLEQVPKLIHTSNYFQIPKQVELAEKLLALTGLSKCFFGNSGAEANETAIKLARLYGHQQGIDNPAIIVMEHSFHGRTMATLTATGSRKAQAGFEPLVPGFVRAPFNDIAAVEAIAQNRQDITAIMVEPIQGEGGVKVPAENYLTQLRRICDEQNWLLILDEIQTGIGRTGALFACQHENVLPDILTVAKSLGGGFPVSACLMGAKTADLFQPGMHGTTFGGNPLAMSAGLAVIDTVVSEKLSQHAGTVGEYLFKGLQAALADHPLVVNIRGKGLMIGIELSKPCRPLLKHALEQHLLVSVTANTVVRLLPALTITEKEVDQLIERLVAALKTFAET